MGQVLFCTPKGRLGPWRWVMGVLGEGMYGQGS